MDFITRQATIEDASQIASVHIASRNAAYKTIVPNSILENQLLEKEEAMWLEVLRKNPENVIVAVKGKSKIVGFIGFGPSRHKESEGEIYAMYNSPQYIRSGVGSLLWKAAKEQLVTRGYSAVQALVITENMPARKFYESMGFTLVKDSESTFTWEGEILNEVRYEYIT